jgi:tripartite-type tricarboxylate transporter receptor subunit TctC
MIVKIFAAFALAALLPFPALAQGNYPNKPIRLIVPYAAGGGTDVLARPLAQKVSEALGQQVIVDNRPGASAIIGVDATAKAAPDGYTLVITPSSPIVINPHVFKKLPYDPAKDLTPVTQVNTIPVALLVNENHPAKNLKEFIAWVKAKPKQASFASYGNASMSHLAGEAFSRAIGGEMVHVPYKGTAPAITDLVGGQVATAIVDVGAAKGQLEAGKLRALAITGAKRSPVLPEVPTFGEQGYPALEQMLGWIGIFAPTGTPTEIVNRLASEFAKAVHSPEIKARFLELGNEPTGTTPGEFAEIVKKDAVRWGKIIQDIGGITLD